MVEIDRSSIAASNFKTNACSVTRYRRPARPRGRRRRGARVRDVGQRRRGVAPAREHVSERRGCRAAGHAHGCASTRWSITPRLRRPGVGGRSGGEAADARKREEDRMKRSKRERERESNAGKGEEPTRQFASLMAVTALAQLARSLAHPGSYRLLLKSP